MSPISVSDLATGSRAERIRWNTQQAADMISKVSRPKPGEICSSALTAVLVLTYSRKLIAAGDLVELLVTFLPSPKDSPEDDISPFLPDIHEGMFRSSHMNLC